MNEKAENVSVQNFCMYLSTVHIQSMLSTV